MELKGERNTSRKAGITKSRLHGGKGLGGNRNEKKYGVRPNEKEREKENVERGRCRCSCTESYLS